MGSILFMREEWSHGVKLSRDAMALFVVLLVCVLVIILLTPIGFETRPQSDLMTLGYVAIGTIFTGLALFFVPIIGDRAGAFFSLPIPPAINMLEYLLVVVLFATLFLAWRVYSKRTAASKQPMDSGKQTPQ